MGVTRNSLANPAGIFTADWNIQGSKRHDVLARGEMRTICDPRQPGGPRRQRAYAQYSWAVKTKLSSIQRDFFQRAKNIANATLSSRRDENATMCTKRRG